VRSVGCHQRLGSPGRWGFCRPCRGWVFMGRRNPALTRWAIVCRPSGPGARLGRMLCGSVSCRWCVSWRSINLRTPAEARSPRRLQPLRCCFRFPRESGVRFATPGYPLKSLRDRGNKPKGLFRSRSRYRTGPSRPCLRWKWVRGGDVLIALGMDQERRRGRHHPVPEVFTGFKRVNPARQGP
jgi:hypothetical protein